MLHVVYKAGLVHTECSAQGWGQHMLHASMRPLWGTSSFGIWDQSREYAGPGMWGLVCGLIWLLSSPQDWMTDTPGLSVSILIPISQLLMRFSIFHLLAEISEA